MFVQAFCWTKFARILPQTGTKANKSWNRQLKHDTYNVFTLDIAHTVTVEDNSNAHLHQLKHLEDSRYIIKLFIEENALVIRYKLQEYKKHQTTIVSLFNCEIVGKNRIQTYIISERLTLCSRDSTHLQPFFSARIFYWWLYNVPNHVTSKVKVENINQGVNF